MVSSYLTGGVVGRAVERGHVSVEGVDIRAFSTNKHRTVDDVPFGGGAGMVMKAEPVARAIESVGPVAKTVLLTPSGRTFKQADAAEWSKLDSLLLHAVATKESTSGYGTTWSMMLFPSETMSFPVASWARLWYLTRP